MPRQKGRSENQWPQNKIVFRLRSGAKDHRPESTKHPIQSIINDRGDIVQLLKNYGV